MSSGALEGTGEPQKVMEPLSAGGCPAVPSQYRGVTASLLESSGWYWGTVGGHWGVLGSTDKLQTAPGAHQEAAESPGVAPGGCLGGSGLRKAGLRGEDGFGRRAKGRSRTACGAGGGILGLPAGSWKAALTSQQGSGAVAVPR